MDRRDRDRVSGTWTGVILPGLLTALIGAISACASDPEIVAAVRADSILEEIRADIAGNKAEAAIGRISGLRSGDLLTPGQLDSLQGEAVERIQSTYAAALETNDLPEAIRLYRSMETLGRAPENGSLNDLMMRLAGAYRDQGNLPAAVSTLLRVPQLSELPANVIEELAYAALELNNRHAARVAIEVLGPGWIDDHPDVRAFLEEIPSPVLAVESTATIWVNRGIRLEQGIGYPDRVIGSGFFIDPRGYLVTNHHVIESEVDPEYEGYSRLYVRLPDDPDERIPARVIGFDRIFDIALVKVELDAPSVLSFSDIRSLEPGKRIVAIGSPGGLENTVTSGIVSATGRRFLQLGDAMQVDVPINPGNSGGPLLDENGNVVGVVFAGIEQFEGINFAIPSYWIQHFLPDLYSNGEVVHPWIGVAVNPVESGLEVVYVAADSPAGFAGIEVGDTITRLGGWDTFQIGSAQRVLLGYDPGSLIRIEWERSGRTQSGVIALGERPFSPVEEGLDRDLPEKLYPVLFGFHVSRQGASSLTRRYRVDRVYRGSIADETGITEGDTFTERDFEVDDELRIALLRIVVKKRTEGFMQTGIQLPAYIETDIFL